MILSGGPTVTLTHRELAMLWTVGGLGNARIQQRDHREEPAYVMLSKLHAWLLENRTSVDGQNSSDTTDKDESGRDVEVPTRIAAVLGVSVRTVTRDIIAGRLPATKLDRRWLILTEDAVAYVNARKAR